MKPRDPSPDRAHTGPFPISVSLPGHPAPLRFTSPFRIGRLPPCEVCIPDDFVSRVHAEVTPTPEGWQIRDLESSNGLYLNGEPMEKVNLSGHQVICLGAEGPSLTFETHTDAHTPAAPGDATIIARYTDRYLREPDPNQQTDEQIGEHTQFIRRAFATIRSQSETAHKKAQAHRTAVFASIIGALLLATSVISGFAWRLHRENQRQRDSAREIFYSMKSLDVEIAQAEQAALAADSQHGAEFVDKYEARRKQMKDRYDHILIALHFDRAGGTEVHRLIVRVASIFGECELDIPAGFEQEVMRYIEKWQTSSRFSRDIRLAQQKNYTRTIPQALLKRGLPVQFFYLAMQESHFDPYAIGPLTHSGYAKGMWQFIPSTGVRYGLHLGPYADGNRPDADDDRDQVDKSTEAAARYLDFLYSTDAQASGLLVMACYNWGEGSVLSLVRSMPPNPRQRNFWRLLSDHREQIPQQTYDYVFMITAAAVIGENPRLFGFDFDNPLAGTLIN